MKFACALIFALCASSFLIQVKGEDVTAEEVQQILKTLGKLVAVQPATLNKLLNSAPAVPLTKFSEIKENLRQAGLSAGTLGMFDGIVSAVLKARDSPSWPITLAPLLTFMQVPTHVIGKLKKEAPPKFPTSVAEITTLLEKAGMKRKEDDKTGKTESVKLFMKWLGNIQYA